MGSAGFNRERMTQIKWPRANPGPAGSASQNWLADFVLKNVCWAGPVAHNRNFFSRVLVQQMT